MIRKSLYNLATERVNINIQCAYYLNTGTIKIHTSQHKIPDCEDKAKTNKESPQYLGITIAENMLSKIFKNVEVMPSGNKGFDIICNKGFKIDIKCATQRKNRIKSAWMFSSRKNQMADFFLCLAFDNRKQLNPKHVWLIPTDKVKDQMGITISESKLNRWKEYELNNTLNEVVEYCNIKKEMIL